MIDAVFTAATRNLSGDFWGRHLHPESRVLFSALRSAAADAGVAGAIGLAAGSGIGELVVSGPRLIPYDPDEVVCTASGFAEWIRHRTDTGWEASHPAALDWSTLLLNATALPEAVILAGEVESAATNAIPASWFIPLPEDCRPLVIAGKRWLVAGIDFHVWDGWLEFHETPSNLFEPSSGICVARESRKIAHALDYPFETDAAAPVSAEHARHAQNASTLLTSALLAAGFVRVPGACEILAKVRSGYLTSEGPLEVPYDHTELLPGAVLESGAFIGISAELRSLDTISATDFPDGIPLREITPWDLVIPPGAVRVDVVAGKIRPFFIGDESVLQRFWGWLEADAGTALAEHMEWEDGQHSVNWFNLLRDSDALRHVWFLRISLDTVSPLLENLVIRHLQERKPLGVVIITSARNQI